MQQYPIPSSDEGQVGRSIAPEEFDIPHLYAITHARNSTIGLKQSYFSHGSDTVAQSTLSNPSRRLKMGSRELSRTGPLSTLTRSSSAQIYDASGELSVTNPTPYAAAAEPQTIKINSLTLGAEELPSMDSSEALVSPQIPFTNNKTGASASTNILSKSDMQNLDHSAEKHDENLTNDSERDRENNGKMLLPNHGTSSALPAGKVFPIQIGSELFKLSGASISSDGKN